MILILFHHTKNHIPVYPSFPFSPFQHTCTPPSSPSYFHCTYQLVAILERGHCSFAVFALAAAVAVLRRRARPPIRSPSRPEEKLTSRRRHGHRSTAAFITADFTPKVRFTRSKSEVQHRHAGTSKDDFVGGNLSPRAVRLNWRAAIESVKAETPWDRVFVWKAGTMTGKGPLVSPSRASG